MSYATEGVEEWGSFICGSFLFGGGVSFIHFLIHMFFFMDLLLPTQTSLFLTSYSQAFYLEHMNMENLIFS